MELLNKADCDKAITSIKNRGVKLDQDIHQAACSSIEHLAQHGDVTLCNRLLLAMPKSGRRNALAAWMLNFGRLALNDVKETKADMPMVYAKDKESDVVGGIAMPFWKFKVSEGGVAFMMDTYLASVSKRLQAALKTTTDPTARAHAESVLAALSVIPLGKVEVAPVVAEVVDAPQLDAAMPV